MSRSVIAVFAALVAVGAWAAPAAAQNDGSWTTKPNTTFAVSRFFGGVRSTSNNIYVGGGVQWTTPTTGSMTRQTYRYNPTTNTLAPLASQMPTNQMWGSSAVVNDVLYCFTGANTTTPTLTSITYAFNMTTETWGAALAPIPAGRIYSTAVAVGTDIYVMGGSDLTQFVNRNDRYNTVTNTWTTAANLPLATGYRYGGMLSNTVILAGGADANGVIGSTDLFDPVGGTWTGGVSFMNPPMADGGSCVVPGFNRMYCTGGVDGNNLVPATMEFHLPTRSWKRLEDLPTGTGSRMNMLFTVNLTSPPTLNLIGGEGQPLGFNWLDFTLPTYGPNAPAGPYFHTLNGPPVGPGSYVGQQVLFAATVTDLDSLDSVALEVEVRPAGDPWQNTPTASGSLSSQGLVEIYHPQLANGQYQVRYRARDQYGDYSQGGWVDLLSPLDPVDFTVDSTIVFEDTNHGAGDGLFGDKGTCSSSAGFSSWGLLVAASAMALLAMGRRLA